MLSFLFHVLEQSFLLLPLLLGLYLSFHVLRIDDITADGSFVLGAAVFAKAITFHLSPVLALLLAVSTSALVGVVNSLMQIRKQMSPLLVSVLLLFMLASVTLVLMGQPNLSLIDRPTLFSDLERQFPQTSTIFIRAGVSGGLGILMSLLFYLLLQSRVGLIFRAYGDQPSLLSRLGRNPTGYRTLGLLMSSSLAGLSGALTAQSWGYAALSMGAGQALLGIALVVLGLHLGHAVFPSASAHKISGLLGLFLSAFLYFVAIAVLSRLGINPLYIRLLLSLCLSFFFLCAPSLFRFFQRSSS